MDKLTDQEYYEQCRAIVAECTAEAEGDEDRMNELIHEAIDSHQWIIYTFYNLEILRISQNTDAYFDNFGKLEAADFSSAVQSMAFAAFEADVYGEMGQV